MLIFPPLCDCLVLPEQHGCCIVCLSSGKSLVTDETVSLNNSKLLSLTNVFQHPYIITVVLTHFLPRPMSLSWPQSPFWRERAISDFVDRHIDTYWKRSAQDYSRPCRPGPLLHLQTGLLDMCRQFSFHSLSIWRRQGGTWAGNRWTGELRAAVTQRTAHTLACFTSAACGQAQGANDFPPHCCPIPPLKARIFKYAGICCCTFNVSHQTRSDGNINWLSMWKW